MQRINCVKFNEEATLIISGNTAVFSQAVYPSLAIITLSLSPPLGSYDSSVRVWDCRTRVHDPVQVMDEAKDSVTSLGVTTSEILSGYVHTNSWIFIVYLQLLCYFFHTAVQWMVKYDGTIYVLENLLPILLDVRMLIFL